MAVDDMLAKLSIHRATTFYPEGSSPPPYAWLMNRVDFFYDGEGPQFKAIEDEGFTAGYFDVQVTEALREIRPEYLQAADLNAQRHDLSRTAMLDSNLGLTDLDKALWVNENDGKYALLILRSLKEVEHATEKSALITDFVGSGTALYVPGLGAFDSYTVPNAVKMLNEALGRK